MAQNMTTYILGADGQVMHEYTDSSAVGDTFIDNAQTGMANVDINNLTAMTIAMADSLAKLTSICEEINAKLETHISLASNRARVVEETVNPSDAFELIDTVEAIVEFERRLIDRAFLKGLAPRLYSVCGPGIKGDNAAYRLVDAIFTRRFFTLVSWTGKSRGLVPKENFSRFQRTFKFIFKLVQRVDPQYTQDSLKKFFRRITDNSKRRYESFSCEKARISTARTAGNPRKRVKLENELQPQESAEEEPQPEESVGHVLQSEESVVDEPRPRESVGHVPQPEESAEDEPRPEESVENGPDYISETDSEGFDDILEEEIFISSYVTNPGAMLAGGNEWLEEERLLSDQRPEEEKREVKKQLMRK